MSVCLDFGQEGVLESNRAEGEIRNDQGEKADRVDHGKGVVGRRVERLGWVRVHLNANAQVLLGEPEPEIVQPAIVEHKAAGVRLVLRVDSPTDCIGRVPGADPKDLTFASSATAAAEVRKGLIKDATRQSVDGGH